MINDCIDFAIVTEERGRNRLPIDVWENFGHCVNSADGDVAVVVVAVAVIAVVVDVVVPNKIGGVCW